MAKKKAKKKKSSKKSFYIKAELDLQIPENEDQPTKGAIKLKISKSRHMAYNKEFKSTDKNIEIFENIGEVFLDAADYIEGT